MVQRAVKCSMHQNDPLLVPCLEGHIKRWVHGLLVDVLEHVVIEANHSGTYFSLHKCALAVIMRWQFWGE